jgi:hypothetical protein
MLHIISIMLWQIHIIIFFDKRKIYSIIDIRLFSSPSLVATSARKTVNVSSLAKIVHISQNKLLFCCVLLLPLCWLYRGLPELPWQVTIEMGNWVTVWFELKWTSPATTTTAAAAASASVSAVVYHLSKLDTRSTYTVSPTILNKGKELT